MEIPEPLERIEDTVALVPAEAHRRTMPPTAAYQIVKEAASFIGPTASGVLLGFAFVEPRLQILAWVALVPIAWTMVVSRGPAKYVGALAGGTVCHLMALDFLRQAYDGNAVLSWLATAAILACFWPLALAIDQFGLARTSLPLSLRLPLVWTAMEFLRMQFASVIMGSPVQYVMLGSIIGDELYLAQIADLGGVYPLTWLVASVNGAICDVLIIASRMQSDRRLLVNRVVGLALIASLLAATLCYSTWRLSQPFSDEGPRLALIPGSVPLIAGKSVESATALRKRLMQSSQSGAGTETDLSPDLCVWSEGACGAPLVFEESAGNRNHATVEAKAILGVLELERLANGMQTSILTGCELQRFRPGDALVRRYNSAAYIRPDQGFAGAYDKIVLVPWTETQPSIASALGLLPAPRGDAAYGGPFQPGDRYATFELKTADDAYRFATTICFEIAFPNLHRRFMTEHSGQTPQFFLNVANESAFEGSLYGQVSIIAQRLRAIECRRAYGRIAQNGMSALVDGCGRVLTGAHTGDNGQTIQARLPIDTRQSLYVLLGDWLPLGSCLVVCGFGLRRIRRRAR